VEEPATRAAYRLGHIVEETAEAVAADAVEDHERRMHIPPPRRGRVTAIPFPTMSLDDSQVCRAWEMMKLGATLEEASAALGVPDLVLVRSLHEYQPAWQQFLQERASGT
jgi:hypothetical protein